MTAVPYAHPQRFRTWLSFTTPSSLSNLTSNLSRNLLSFISKTSPVSGPAPRLCGRNPHSCLHHLLPGLLQLPLGFTHKSLHKLQLVQNSAARIITRTPSIHHITPVLQQLHWLPVKSRINYKILLLTFKAIHNLAPTYLSDLLHVVTPSRSLRSSSSIHLSVPSARLTTMGSRAFSRSAPKLWNSLPPVMRNITSLSQFKSSLKTHLFKIAFSV